MAIPSPKTFPLQRHPRFHHAANLWWSARVQHTGLTQDWRSRTWIWREWVRLLAALVGTSQAGMAGKGRERKHTRKGPHSVTEKPKELSSLALFDAASSKWSIHILRRNGRVPQCSRGLANRPNTRAPCQFVKNFSCTCLLKNPTYLCYSFRCFPIWGVNI